MNYGLTQVQLIITAPITQAFCLVFLKSSSWNNDYIIMILVFHALYQATIINHDNHRHSSG